jgi:tripeptide aminopeptidase
LTPSLSGLVDDVVALARIPAPTFGERERLDWIERRLAGAPGTRSRDGAGNLLWTWGDGPPRLLLTAHTDTVFPKDTPLDVRRVDGQLRGPGIGDNAAAIALAISVLEELHPRTELAPGAIAFTVAEEGMGNLRGAIAAYEALRPQTVIALEGHGLNSVFVDAVGSVRAQIAVQGPGGHSWVDRGRPSAVHALLELGRSLLAEASPATPVNVGVVSGGRSVNSIAETASLVVEMRALDERPLDDFAARLETLEAEPPLCFQVQELGRRPAGRLERGSPLLRSVCDVRAELGLPATLDAGSTDANAAIAAGIPALALGVAHGSGMHTLAESIDVESLALGRRQLELLLLRLLA